MKRVIRVGSSLLAALAACTVFASATEARAQDNAPAPTTKAPDDSPDHDKFIGHFAVGYFGVQNLPIGPVPAGGGAYNTVPTPIIGVRYWLMQSLGLDLGVGFSTLSGSQDTTTNNASTSVDHPSQLGFALHGGVPLALAEGHHFTFEVVPELNLGFTSGTIKGTTAGGVTTPDTDLSGFLFALGARVGGEINFGFIGVPELALEGSVGLYLQRQAVKASQNQNSVSDGTWSFGTTVGSTPWAIFTNNISALYYF